MAVVVQRLELKIYKEETLPKNMNKRVCFPEGIQKKLIKEFKKKSGLNWRELAKKSDTNENTLSKAYRFETCNIPYSLLNKISNVLKLKEKDILTRYKGKIEDEISLIKKGTFGKTKKKLDPINITFENTNLDLNSSNINYSKTDFTKKIKLPNKITPNLAEEIGMHYGDGFLSATRYDYRLKGNPKDEVEYYLSYIKPMFKELYNLDLNVKKFEKSFGFETYSKALWEFKKKVIGIKPGKKYDISFPETLKVNNIKILAGFIRGLFDTDGSLSFKSIYGYERYYPAIEISLTSKKLIKEVGEIIKMLGFNPSIYFNDKYGRISIYGVASFNRYEELIGWSSPKNIKKVSDWKRRYPNMVVVV